MNESGTFETNIKAILAAIDRAKINDNGKKVVVDRLADLMALKLSYESRIKKLEQKGINLVGDYDSMFAKAVDLLKLFGWDENRFLGFNSQFLRWMGENIPKEKYTGQLMNTYIIEGLCCAWVICQSMAPEKDKDGWGVVTWSEVKKMYLDPESEIEINVNSEYEKKLMELIDGNDFEKEVKFKQYNQLLKK